MSEPEYLIGRHLNQAARALRRDLAAEMRGQGLTDTMYIVMRTVDDAMEQGRPALTAAQLAEELNLSTESVNEAIDRLVRDSLVSLLDSETRLIALNEKSRALMPGITDTANWTIRRAISGFSGEEIDALSDYLQRIIANLR